LWTNKSDILGVTVVPEEKRILGRKKFEEIMAENYLILVTNINLHTKTQWTPNRSNAKRTVLKLTRIKLQKPKEKRPYIMRKAQCPIAH
jgi:hypothetical protein